ncbi:MAG: hypothetical protein GX087_09595, partial [Desulfobulbaceae bacterium]|nr:hypothetical protein [Desulfobulbaceae bacterium]
MTTMFRNPGKAAFALLVFSCVCACLLLFALPAFASSPAIQRYNWQGQIKKSITVSAWWEIQDGIVAGTLSYAKYSTNGKLNAIRLLGEVLDNGRLRLCEMLPDGRISGIIEGSLSPEGFTGTWTAPDRITADKNGRFSAKEGKTYPISLTPSAAAQEPLRWQADSADMTGKYAYSYGPYQASGVVEVSRATADGAFDYKIDASTSAPAFNMAKASAKERMQGLPPAKTVLENNRILHEDGEDCAFELLFFHDFLVIRMMDQRFCLGSFGMGATVA